MCVMNEIYENLILISKEINWGGHMITNLLVPLRHP